MAKKPNISGDDIIPEPGDGIPGMVREKIDNAVTSLRDKVNDTGWEAASMGIGKGVLIGAALYVANSMFWAVGGPLPVSSALDLGFRQGLYGLFQSPNGAITMALGAAFGAIGDLQGEHNKLEKDLAETRSDVQSASRDLALVKAQAKDHNDLITEMAGALDGNFGFVARENMRRQQGYGAQGVQP